MTKVAAPQTVQVSNLVVSADEQRLAWSEQISKPSAKYGVVYVGSRVVVRNNVDGTTTTVKGGYELVGFAGHTLIVESGYTKKLVLTPTPHFVRVSTNADTIATYPKGMVDDVFAGASSSTVLSRERLRLTTLAGHNTFLHTYDVGKTYREPGMGAVSPDGERLVVERGDHEDFDGLGPTSLFDEYTLSGSFPRRTLGHYGSNAAKWRLQTAAFVGKNDQVWLALHNYAPAVRGVVVRYVGGKWQLVENHAVTVAGSPLGYAAVQPGKWVLSKVHEANDHHIVPTADAQLWFDGAKVGAIPAVQAVEMVWVNGLLPTA